MDGWGGKEDQREGKEERKMTRTAFLTGTSSVNGWSFWQVNFFPDSVGTFNISDRLCRSPLSQPRRMQMQGTCEKLWAKRFKNLNWLYFFFLNRKHLEQREQLAAEDEICAKHTSLNYWALTCVGAWDRFPELIPLRCQKFSWTRNNPGCCGR